MTVTSGQDKPKGCKSIPLWLLVTIVVSLAAGLVGGMLLSNALTSNQINFSTPSIISLVFTVALGAAAIILAALTIVLSRIAEDALIRRSDEGIKLQNDVFIRTSEVLSTIQASTGVTEKRLEDIITGRTGIIAQEVFDKSLVKGDIGLSKEAEERLKKSLAETLKEELLPLRASRPSLTERHLAEMEERQKKSAEINNRWKQYRSAVLWELKQAPGMRVVSETEGSIGATTMEEFWDAVFDVNGRKVGIDIHTKGQMTEGGSLWNDIKSGRFVDEYAKGLTWRVIEDKINILCFVWDQDVSQEGAFVELLERLRPRISDTTLLFLHGEPKDVLRAILSHVAAGQQTTPEVEEKAHPKDPPAEGKAPGT